MDVLSEIFDRDCVLILGDKSMLSVRFGRILEWMHIGYHFAASVHDRQTFRNSRGYRAVFIGLNFQGRNSVDAITCLRRTIGAGQRHRFFCIGSPEWTERAGSQSGW